MGWMDWYYRSQYDSKVKNFWLWLKAGYLLDQTSLGASWWNLTLTSRKDIGKRIIEAYCKPLPGKLRTRENSTKPWFDTSCLGRAILQNTLLDDMGRYPDMWLAEWDCWGEPRSYYVNPLVQIKLPVTCAIIVCVAKNWYHAVSALQIDQRFSMIGSWIFFWGSTGILPVDGSNSQIPHGSVVTLQSMDSRVITYTPHSFGSVVHGGNTVIVTFNIP